MFQQHVHDPVRHMKVLKVAVLESGCHLGKVKLLKR